MDATLIWHVKPVVVTHSRVPLHTLPSSYWPQSVSDAHVHSAGSPVPRQFPLVHLSPVEQTVPSSQGFVLFAVVQPARALQTASWQKLFEEHLVLSGVCVTVSVASSHLSVVHGMLSSILGG